MPNYITPAIERFSAKVVPEPEGACWIWYGARSKGYGYFPIYVAPRVPMKSVLAHRWSYENHIGPIPEGLDVLHECDNPSCVNPWHLFPGTHQDNMDDREAKGRGVVPRGVDHGRAVLNPDLVREIRASKESAKGMARRLGISFTAIRQARVRLTWKHIE